MDRTVNDGFKFNLVVTFLPCSALSLNVIILQETEMVPVLGLASAQLNKAPSNPDGPDDNALNTQKNHHSVFLNLLSEETGFSPDEIHDFEL